MINLASLARSLPGDPVPAQLVSDSLLFSPAAERCHLATGFLLA